MLLKITVAEHSGFCFGVKNAVKLAEEAIIGLESEAYNQVFCLGKLIHNEEVTDRLERRGIVNVGSVDELLKRIANCFVSINNNSSIAVIIRSHGITKLAHDTLIQYGFHVIDTTCLFVKKIHNIVHAYYCNNHNIIILGNKSHPEVIGINGWCDNKAVIIENESDIDELFREIEVCVSDEIQSLNCPKLPFLVSNPYICVVQTTFNVELYKKLSKKIKEKISKIFNKTVEFFDTICYTTLDRQKEVQNLAKKCDCVLVIGSKNSSNTVKLADIAFSLNNRTYLVSQISCFKSIQLNNKDHIAIVAGASTPPELVSEVKQKLMAQQFEEIHDKDFIEALENESTVNLREGMRVKGIVLTVDEKGISLNIGQKKDGFIYADQAGLGEYSPSDYLVGQELEAVVVPAIAGEKDYINLSKKRIDVVHEGDKQVDSIRNGETFELKITSNADGDKGLLGKLGTYTIFIPASQIKIERVKDTKKYVGKHLRVIATEIDDDKRKIIASARKLLEEEKKTREEVFWANVTPDVIVSGRVKRLADFGAFVSVDGIDCLAHVSDLAYGKIKSPDEAVKVGEVYDFLVLSVDPAKKRVSLSLKALAKHPFELFTETNPVGSSVKGKIISIVPFGVFVSLAKGVEGLVHVSEVAHGYIKTPADVIKVGEEVAVLIKEVHPDRRKISLSIKALLPEPTPEELDVKKTKKETEEVIEERAEGESKPAAPKKSQIDKFESRMAEADKPVTEELAAEAVEGEMQAVEGERPQVDTKSQPEKPKSKTRSTVDKESKSVSSITRGRGGAPRAPREARPPRGAETEGTGQEWQDQDSVKNNLFATLLKDIDLEK